MKSSRLKRKKWIKRRSESRVKRDRIYAAVRWEILKSSEGHCARCDIYKGKAGLQVHHIHPRSRGGGDEAENLAPLCIECHDDIHFHTPEDKDDWIK